MKKLLLSLAVVAMVAVSCTSGDDAAQKLADSLRQDSLMKDSIAKVEAAQAEAAAKLADSLKQDSIAKATKK